VKKRIRIVIPILVILIVGGYFLRNGRTDPNVVKVSGNIETTDVRLGFQIAGRLAERLVDEGQPVTKGQLVARLDATDQQLAVSTAEANLSYAQSVLAELEAGNRPEEIAQAKAQMEQARLALVDLQKGNRSQDIADAGATLKRAKAGVETAKSDLELAQFDETRFAELLKSKVVGVREYEGYRTKLDAAKNALTQAREQEKSAREQLSLREEGPRIETIEKARAAYEQTQQQYELVKTGPRKETIDQARAKCKAAEEALKQAQRQLEYTRLVAPFAGVVLGKSAEPGEFLTIGSPVLTIGQLDQVWLRAYVGETQLGRVELDRKAEVVTDSLPGRTFTGTVAFISDQAEFTPKSVQTDEERVKLMYRIKIDLDNPDHKLKPGMPADAIIRPENAPK
jgi:HlyD family secretion protein